MTSFRFEAAREDGAVVRGSLDAPTAADAAAVLSDRGLFPVRVDERRAAVPSLFGGPSRRAVATVFRGLASLVEAGVPLERALGVAERVAPPAVRASLSRVRARVTEGTALGTALAAEGPTFPAVAIGLVRAGERGVGLGAALAQAATQLEREAEAAGRVRAALAYPALLAVVGTASVALIALVVVPRFASLLGDLGQELPVATRVLVVWSDLLRRYGVVGLPVFVGAGAVAAHLARVHRATWHRSVLDWPLLGPVRHAFASARAARALGSLLATGGPALAALTTATEAAGDEGVRARLVAARERIAEGEGLAAALSATRALTPTAIQLLAIGEGSGRVGELLARAADLDEAEAERRVRAVVTLLEPALILAFAAVVAFVAAALLQAVYAVRPM